VALSILPTEGNFATLKVVRQFRESLSLTEEEIKEYDVKQDGDKIIWNQKGIEEKEIVIGEFAMDMIKSKLKKMNDDNKLEEKHFSLYEKFVETK
jgi:hypothetical protein